MEEQKQLIVAGAKQYLDYLTSQVPQRDDNGNLRYYFSGSLAMLLLSSARSIKPSFLDAKGKVVCASEEMSIPDRNRESLAVGVRPIGQDVDIVTIDDTVFDGKVYAYELSKMREKCDLATTLCPKWANGGGTMYVDLLASDRTFDGFDVAELTLLDSTKAVIADPLSLITHKFADALGCKTAIEIARGRGRLTSEKLVEYDAKYEKDLKDFASMFNGVVALYGKMDFNKVVEHILQTCPDTAFAKKMHAEVADKIKQFWFDCKELIEADSHTLFSEYIQAVNELNKFTLSRATGMRYKR